jgi:membrane associated rhomboid family serine protease
MRDRDDVAVMGAFPRPGRALWGVLLTLFGIWLAFAVGLGWANLSEDVFLLFAGNTQKILHGEVWRLFTAPLMHEPVVMTILFVLIGFYFLTPTLEQQWGGKRLIGFLLLSGTFGYLFQMGLELALPRSIGQKLVGDHWWGSTPVIAAIAIAWALTFRGQTVRLFFVLPVSSRGLILFTVGVAVLYVLAPFQRPSSGLLSPFGGMLAGWIFGGSPSPLRRAWLKFRLKRLESELETGKKQRAERVKRSGLRVIEGGGAAPPKDDDEDRRGPDGRLLN